MKIALFGPTGGTGKAVIEHALASGYTITALVRTPAKLNHLKNDRLQLVHGDVLNYEDVLQVVKGQEAVLCCLGTRAADKRTLRADGTANIIRAMQDAGVERLICQTSLGYGDTAAVMPWYMTYIIIPLILKNAFPDHELQESRIEATDLRWTIIRPGSLTNGPKTERYRFGFPPNTKTKLSVSRADVAHFMLSQLDSEEFIRQKVGISY